MFWVTVLACWLGYCILLTGVVVIFTVFAAVLFETFNKYIERFFQPSRNSWLLFNFLLWRAYKRKDVENIDHLEDGLRKARNYDRDVHSLQNAIHLLVGALDNDGTSNYTVEEAIRHAVKTSHEAKTSYAPMPRIPKDKSRAQEP
jgi:hypothetical protein